MTTTSVRRVAAVLAGLMLVGACAAAPALAASDAQKAVDEKAPAAATAAAADEEKADDARAHELPKTNEWYEAADCETCHSKQVGTFENDKCLAKTHAAFLECSGCHNVDDLALVHDGVTEKDKAPSALKKTKFDVEASCTTCHQTDKLAEATKDCDWLTDSNGTTVNPHDVPAVEDHVRELTCVSCHKVHSTTGIQKSAGRACSSCHHAGVYECNTCHS